MNLKHLCTGIVLSGLGVLSFGTQADAYSFNFLSRSANGSNPTYTDYKFGFQADANEPIAPLDKLTVSGFLGIQSLGFTNPTNNVAGVLPAGQVFNLGTSTDTTAQFIARADINSILGVVRYETFVVTALDVPTGDVQSNFAGNDLGSTAVPEPLTILGAMTAAGFGAAFKRRSSKSA